MNHHQHSGPPQPGEHQPPPPPPGGPGTAWQHPGPGEEPAALNRVTLPRFLQPVAARHMLHLLSTYAVTYVALMIIAVVALVSTLIGFAASSDGQATTTVEATGDDLGITALAVILAVPFQVVGSLLMGRFSLTVETGLFGGAPLEVLDLWAPNLLLLAAGMAVGLAWSRWLSRRTPEGALSSLPLPARITLAASFSLVSALLVLLVTRVTALRGSAESPGEDISAVGHSASLGLFFGSWAVFAAIGLILALPAGALGRASARVESWLPSLGRSLGVLGIHLAFVGTVVLVAALITVGTETGPVGLFTGFLWAGSAVIYGFIALLSGGLALRIDGGTFGQTITESHTAFLWNSDLDWWILLLAIILSLAGLVLASVAWLVRRNHRPEVIGHPLSWVTLPLVYLLAGTVFTLFAQVRLSGDVGVGSGSMTAGPAWWTFAVFLGWGIVLELLSRFAAPHLADVTPRPVLNLLRGRRYAIPATHTGTPPAPAPGPDVQGQHPVDQPSYGFQGQPYTNGPTHGPQAQPPAQPPAPPAPPHLPTAPPSGREHLGEDQGPQPGR